MTRHLHLQLRILLFVDTILSRDKWNLGWAFISMDLPAFLLQHSAKPNIINWKLCSKNFYFLVVNPKRVRPVQWNFNEIQWNFLWPLSHSSARSQKYIKIFYKWFKLLSSLCEDSNFQVFKERQRWRDAANDIILISISVTVYFKFLWRNLKAREKTPILYMKKLLTI